MDGWMVGWIEKKYEKKDGWLDGYKKKYEKKDGWLDGWIKKYITQMDG